MPFVQRTTDGLVIGKFTNLQPGYAEEWLSDDSPELIQISPDQLVRDERAWRDTEIAHLAWARDRHRDQLELDADTTLTTEQFNELMIYFQNLREWPQSEAFPDVSHRPQSPKFLEQFRGVR